MDNDSDNSQQQHWTCNSTAIETVFWLPFGVDLMLLVFTYGYCRLEGCEWFLKETMKHQKQQTPEDDHKKNDGDNKDKEKKLATVEETTPEQKKIQSLLWETFMISYSAYGALLCWATYIAVTQPELRPSLSWAMTGLMAMKLVTTAKVEIDEKFYSLIFFYIPTYGGYAMYKTVAC